MNLEGEEEQGEVEEEGEGEEEQECEEEQEYDCSSSRVCGRWSDSPLQEGDLHLEGGGGGEKHVVN